LINYNKPAELQEVAVATTTTKEVDRVVRTVTSVLRIITVAVVKTNNNLITTRILNKIITTANPEEERTSRLTRKRATSPPVAIAR